MNNHLDEQRVLTLEREVKELRHKYEPLNLTAKDKKNMQILADMADTYYDMKAALEARVNKLEQANAQIRQDYQQLRVQVFSAKGNGPTR